MKHTLEVAGMHCGGCEGLIGDELGALDGVRVVSASASSGTVQLDVDESKLELAEITRIITELGFTPTI